MNILELPNEIIKEIWLFVSKVEDIIRFGSTCKKIKSLSFEVDERSIVLESHQPLDIWKNIFERDLRHLRKFTVELHEPDRKKIDLLFNSLTVLSTLQNLKSLGLGLTTHAFTIRGSQAPWANQIADLSQTIKKMTWLEELDCTFDFTNDIGGFLIDHTKLTQLRLTIMDFGTGYDKLTQLKSLRLAEDINEEAFKQVLKLSNLTALDTNYTTLSKELLQGISKLTNLQKLTSRKTFVALPKLHYLSLISISDHEYELLNQLTLLTTLHIEAPVDLNLLSKLINLQEFSDRNHIAEQSVDFSVFKNLTYLKVSQPIWQFQLPRGLKTLEMPALGENDETMKAICDIDTIEHLIIPWHVTKSRPSFASVAQLSRLTNLRSLNITMYHPRGVFQHLTGLSTLRSLHLETISEDLIEEIRQLTQLCELTVDYLPYPLTMKAVRQHYPSLAVSIAPQDQT